MKHFRLLAAASLVLAACQSTDSNPKPTQRQAQPSTEQASAAAAQATTQVGEAIEASSTTLREDIQAASVAVQDEAQAQYERLKRQLAGVTEAVASTSEAAMELEKPVLEEPEFERPTFEEPVFEEPVLEEPMLEDSLSQDNPILDDITHGLEDLADRGEQTRAEIDAQIAEAPLEQATAQDAELEHSVLGDPTVEKARAAKLDEQLDQTETEAVDYAEASAPKPVDEISPEMDMAALQARMLELATPGPEHQVLNSLEGKFQAAVKLWMSPEADPLLSVGSMQSSWALGGRFLEGHFAGEMMGQPFYGFGHMGYDKVRESYVGYWVDSMGTQMMNISTGQMSPDRKTLTLGRTILDPLTGKEQPMKEVLTFVDQDHHEWDMWGFSPDGTWYRMLHIDYTRMP